MPETISPEVECLKLKQAINENYRLSQKSAGDAIDRALLVGESLGKWKELLPHGEFEPFVEKHFEGSMRNAQLYMQAAKGVKALPKAHSGALLGTEDSLKGLIKRMKKDKPKKQVSEKGSPGGGLSPSSTVPPASAAPEPGEAADSSDVHTEHCCRKCGCKYGDKKCTVVSGEKLASHPCENCDSGEDERTDLQGTKPQETDPRPPRSGKDKPVDYGKCPVCAGIRWKELKAGVVCAKCGAPHGEPVGDRAEDADPAGIKRAKAVKTCEALMREFDDLNLLVPKAGTHKQSIELCKTLLKSAKGWK